MSDSSFRERRPEDRACINAVVHRYAHNAREGVDINDVLPLFTRDAVAVLPGGTEVPVASLKDVLRGEEAAFIRHHITTIDIQFDGEDSAAVESGFLAVTNEASPDHWGCWIDRFRKQDDQSWLIEQRAIVVHGSSPQGWFARMYTEAE